MLQNEKAQAESLMSVRESIRNKFIDKMGRNPTDAELDALTLASAQAGSSDQSPAPLLRR